MVPEPDPSHEQKYKIQVVAGENLEKQAHARCVEIIQGGDAVDVDSARKELLRATLVAVASAADGAIVGVGAIKQIREWYAADKAKKSGFDFSPTTLEIGYVAVDPKHRGNGLSHGIVKALLSGSKGTLFATTSSNAMKTVLSRAGFAQKGNEWAGQHGQLSLWLSEAK